jgi:hypothetical protein
VMAVAERASQLIAEDRAAMTHESPSLGVPG